jgi:hypothetical protein
LLIFVNKKRLNSKKVHFKKFAEFGFPKNTQYFILEILRTFYFEELLGKNELLLIFVNKKRLNSKKVHFKKFVEFGFQKK